MSFTEQLLHFNLSVALARVGGDEDLLREVAALFLEESADTVAKMRQALENRDARSLHRAAHTLKGAASNFGADPTCDAALNLERMGREGNFDGAEAALTELERAMEQLRPHLAQLAE